MTREQIELRRRLATAVCPVSALPPEDLMFHIELIARVIEARRG